MEYGRNESLISLSSAIGRSAATGRDPELSLLLRPEIKGRWLPRDLRSLRVAGNR